MFYTSATAIRPSNVKARGNGEDSRSHSLQKDDLCIRCSLLLQQTIELLSSPMSNIGRPQMLYKCQSLFRACFGCAFRQSAYFAWSKALFMSVRLCTPPKRGKSDNYDRLISIVREVYMDRKPTNFWTQKSRACDSPICSSASAAIARINLVVLPRSSCKCSPANGEGATCRRIASKKALLHRS